METKSSSIDLRRYLFLLRRRWMLCGAVFLLVLAVGIIYCLTWPKTYEATALVVVQSQKVSDKLVAPVVTSQIEERLQVITQQVLSRTRLTELIDRFNLYPESVKTATPDELAEAMRNKITISISKRNHFTISFKHSDPQKTAAVTNALAAYYVDTNLRLREENAVGTARFLARELERMHGQLREWESRITNFKELHLNELPAAQEKNLYILGRLMQIMMNVRGMIQNERTRIHGYEQDLGVLTYREQQIKMHTAYLRKIGVSVDIDTDEQSNDVASLQKEIERKKLAYTANHPDILRLESQLAIAEAKAAERRAKAKAQGKKGDEPKQDDPAAAAAAEAESIRLSKAQANKRIEEGNQRIKDYQQELDQYQKTSVEVQKRIENGPAVAEKLEELTRGYNTLKEAYDKTQAKWLEANMSANLERTQRGEQFEVVDSAQVPDSPAQPNVRKVIPLTFAVALLLAVGLAFALDYLDNSFTSVEQVERLSELPVLVVIPSLATRKELAYVKRRNTLVGTAYSAVFLVLLAVIGIMMTGRDAALRNMIKGLLT